MPDPELGQLAARVDALERAVAELRGTFGAASPPAPSVARPRAQPRPAALKPRGDVESVVGGRGLLYVGAFLILIGIASFLKIAFDRGWIGPSMRVALGIVAGVVLIAGGNGLRRRLQPLFADTLIGLGAAIEYLALFAGSTLFKLLPLSVVALGMVLVTATLCVLAYRDRRQPLAHLGVIGGLIAPLLVGSSTPDSLVLFVYLAVLSAGAIALGELREWKAVPLVSLIGAAFYWLALTFGNTQGHSPIERLIVALVLYAIYASTTILAWSQKRAIDGWRITVAGLNAAWFFVGISALAYDHRVTLAIVFLALAASHLACGRVFNLRAQYWLATIALTFAIPPIAYSFSGVLPKEALETGMHLAWLAEATAIGTLSVRWNDRVMLALSGAIFTAVVLNAIAISNFGGESARLVLNERFLSLLGAALGIAAVRRALALQAGKVGPGSTLVKILVDLLALIAISPEASHVGRLLQPHDPDAGATVALSIAWALYAGVLIVQGIRAKASVSRWEGLTLIAVTVVKVFAVDLTGVDVVFRVVSFLGLGIVMLALAYLYQSRLRVSKGAAE